MELSLKRHPAFCDDAVSPRTSDLGDTRGCVAKSRAFPFFNQQSGTSLMGLASWFAWPEKPATMTLRGVSRAGNSSRLAFWEK
jgi:hypothetical protein